MELDLHFSDEYSFNCWEASIDFEVFGHLEVQIIQTDEIEKPTTEQINSLAFLHTNQQLILDKIIQVLSTEALENLEELYGYYHPTHSPSGFPIITSKEMLFQFIGFDNIVVHKKSTNGFVYIGFTGNCTWDEEHGFGLIIHKDNVIDIGSYDTATSIHHYSQNNQTTYKTRFDYTNDDQYKEHLKKVYTEKVTFKTNDDSLNKRYENLFDWLIEHRTIAGYRNSIHRIIPIKEKIDCLENCYSLDISGRGLKTLHEDISLLQNLRYFNAGFNQLTTLPKNVDQIQRLWSVNLDNNLFTEIPNAIQSLHNLESLSMSNNHLHQIDFKEPMPHLQTLNLYNNRIKRLPSVLKKMKNLKEIRVEDNSISLIQQVFYRRIYKGGIEIWF